MMSTVSLVSDVEYFLFLLLEASKEKNLLSCSLAKSENSGTLTDMTVTVVTRPPVSNEIFIHNVSEYFYSPQGC